MLKVVGDGWEDESGMVAEKTGLLVMEAPLDCGRRYTRLFTVSAVAASYGSSQPLRHAFPPKAGFPRHRMTFSPEAC